MSMATYIKPQENSISYNTTSKSITRLKINWLKTQFSHMTDIHCLNTSESSDYTRDLSSYWPKYLALMNNINRQVFIIIQTWHIHSWLDEM